MEDKIKNQDNRAPLVSVIIPVYNVEKYIREMLRSVIKQTLQDIEIICIDDGSSDNSCAIIEEYMKKDSRISLLKEEHRNAGVTRNRGLKEAKGEYVVFWDADDIFKHNALELLYKKSQKTKADICACGVYEFWEKDKAYAEGRYLRMDYVPKKETFNKYDVKEYLFDIASNVSWNKLYRREFLLKEHVSFQDIAQGNDTSFVMCAMFLAERITCVNKNLVYYRKSNEGSITSKSSETVFCMYESFLDAKQKLQQYPEFAMVTKSFHNKVASGMMRALDIQTSFDSYVKLYEFLKEEGLEMLGVASCEREDFLENWLASDMEQMKKLSAGDFLLYKDNKRKIERDRYRSILQGVKRRFPYAVSMMKKGKQFLKKMKR